MTEPLLLEEAQRILLIHSQSVCDCETVPLLDAVDRVLAEDVRALRDQPPFPRSPLDGYAVRSADIAGALEASPVQLEVVDEVTAGHVGAKQVTCGMAVRIMTGAPIPEGADCIVRQEDTDYGMKMVSVRKAVGAWKNYCFAGDDYHARDLLMQEGNLIGSAEIGVLASQGATTVKVYRPIRVMVLATGDEIVPPGKPLAPGKIYDSNLHLICARLRQWGIQPIYAGFVADDVDAAARIIETHGAAVDLIVTTGGVSVGKRDIMHDVFTKLQIETLFWRIAIKPGMPALGGLYRNTPVVGLSGNPYGAAAGMELLVRPMLARMSRRDALALRWVDAVVEGEYAKRSPIRRFLRASVKNGRVRPTSGSNDSGVLSSFCGCNCMIDIPAGNAGLENGDMVKVVLL